MKSSRDREWSGKSRGGYWGHKFFVSIIRIFGVRSAYFFLAFIAIYFIPFAPKATRAIWRYNRYILGYGVVKSALYIYMHYYTFGQTLIDKIAINSGLQRRFSFEYDNYDGFLDLLNRGKTIIIGAHMGCWEVGSQFFGDYASKLNVVMYDTEYQRVKEVVQSRKVPYNIIPINEGSIESMVRIKQALDRDEYVCMQGDRFVDRTSAKEVTFMGHRALFASGPTLMASKFGCPVVFYFAMRERGMKYRFIFKYVEGGQSQELLMAQYLKVAEEVLERYPQQWFNFFDVWNIE